MIVVNDNKVEQMVASWILNYLCGKVDATSTEVYSDTELLEGIRSYIKDEDLTSTVETLHGALDTYLEIRMAFLDNWDFAEARYYFTHRRLLDELMRKADTLHADSEARDSDAWRAKAKEFRDAVCSLGADTRSRAYADELLLRAGVI
jgi:hypothetical protein